MLILAPRLDAGARQLIIEIVSRRTSGLGRASGIVHHTGLQSDDRRATTRHEVRQDAELGSRSDGDVIEAHLVGVAYTVRICIGCGGPWIDLQYADILAGPVMGRAVLRTRDDSTSQ